MCNEEDKAKEARRLKWQWVEASIWTDAMLIALDNGVKGNKWFSLIDKVYRSSTLEAAWRKVRANKGAAGVDKVTIKKVRSLSGKIPEGARTETENRKLPTDSSKESVHFKRSRKVKAFRHTFNKRQGRTTSHENGYRTHIRKRIPRHELWISSE